MRIFLALFLILIASFADAAILVPTGVDASTGLYHIATPTDTLLSPPLVGYSGTPALSLGTTTIIGTGATYSITGNNVSGQITLNTGSGITVGTGTVMNLTFANSFAYPNGSVIVFTSANSNFASVLTRLYATGSTTGITLFISGLALSSNTTYIGYYTVTGW